MHKTVLGQVADLLVEEGERRSEVNLSQSTIAALLGVSRQSVNEALGRLRDQGAVETGLQEHPHYRFIQIGSDRRALGVPRLEEYTSTLDSFCASAIRWA